MCSIGSHVFAHFSAIFVSTPKNPFSQNSICRDHNFVGTCAARFSFFITQQKNLVHLQEQIKELSKIKKVDGRHTLKITTFFTPLYIYYIVIVHITSLFPISLFVLVNANFVL